MLELVGVGGQLAEVRFADGTRRGCQAPWYRPVQKQRSPLAAGLGCHLDEAGFVTTRDPFEDTNVPGFLPLAI